MRFYGRFNGDLILTRVLTRLVGLNESIAKLLETNTFNYDLIFNTLELE